MTRRSYVQLAAIAVAVIMVASLAGVQQGQVAPQTVAIDPDDIGGVVTGPRGPEAGVWVIAETKDTPTRLIKTVVTDDQGRYLLPDLPKGNYDVWVRGYGLVDSLKVKAAPGKTLNLTATPAPSPRAAAEYYPALYWYALMQVPPANDFPGTGPTGNGISPTMRSQGEWIRNIVNTDGCTGCHQIGNRATREIPETLGSFPNSSAAWERRVQSGQAGGGMLARFNQIGKDRALKMFADWTDRIAGGEYPTVGPPRPQGKERNVVITMWDWADPKTYLHDEITTDKRNPTVNANGPIYGALEASADYMPVVDPVRNSASQVKLTVRDPKTPSEALTPPAKPSPYWGDETIWTSQANAHSFAMDKQGRVWIAARVRQNPTPDWCRENSDRPSAKEFPINQSGRQIQLYDPKTKQVTTVDTCFGTHHINFDYNDTLWFSGGGPVEGWFNTKVYLETKDEKKAQGWTPFILDTNGNGKRDDYVEPDAPLDPKKDKRIVPGSGPYAVMPSPVDGSISYTVGVLGAMTAVLRFDPATGLSEVYNVPAPAFGIRGGDIDKNGVLWASLSSGHLGSFDRHKCKGPLNGPNATGNHCPEGWTIYQYPGPGFEGIGENSAESSYYTWVDQHDTFGLGENIPMSTANLNDGLVALAGGRMITIRIPYPLGFYAKGFDGRIDDANAGWKG